MGTHDYFDARTLTQVAKGACPVRGCNAVLRSHQRTKRVRLNCPDHEIEIHSDTFVYTNALRNILFERAYFEHAILHNPQKAETHRFGHENSEDALTWNVFAELARKGRLSALAESFLGADVLDEPQLYLWGLRINLDSPATPEPFRTLSAAREVFEKDITRLRTEPDVMLYAPGRFLVLIEAKFTSGNPIAEAGAKDFPGRKPQTPEGILRRYRADQLPPGSLITPDPAAPLFSQLYRNLVFAFWMAAKLRVDWRLVNLTSKLFPKDSIDVVKFTDSVLSHENRRKFVQYTWEQLFHDHIKGMDDLRELTTYLQFKSANCERAFDI